nr:hypothetical protein [Halimeda borneensis]
MYRRKNKRVCRNLQRLVHKTSFIQLLIIKSYILSKSSLVNLKFKKYRNFLNFHFSIQLWIFSLLPILNSQYIVLTSDIQYVLIIKFTNFFNKKNKYWLFSNILIERKFLFTWLKRKKVNLQFRKILENLSLSSELKFIDWSISSFDEHFLAINAQHSYGSNPEEFALQQLIVIPFQNLPKLKETIEKYVKMQALQIKCAKLYSLSFTKKNPKLKL